MNGGCRQRKPSTTRKLLRVSILILLYPPPDLTSVQPPTHLYLPTIMPDTVEGDPPNLDTRWSPVSMSTESSRGGSSKAVHSGKSSEPPMPNSLATRLTRQRAASLNTESPNHPRIGGLALNSVSFSGPLTADPTREQVCLCQPDPKIPRPRNGA